MYHYIDDKDFVQRMRKSCGDTMQELCHYLKEYYKIGSVFYLVGSGARNLIMQNENKPIDLDYNLEIVKCDDINDCNYIKESVRKTFNRVLRREELQDCDDSTSSLTTKLMEFKKGNKTNFSMDVCITYRDEKNNYYRLIHKKTGYSNTDEWIWEKTKNSTKLKNKAKKIKSAGKWTMVRNQYRDLKNLYLKRNDNTHPSFICYIEAVNNVYQQINR